MLAQTSINVENLMKEGQHLANQHFELTNQQQQAVGRIKELEYNLTELHKFTHNAEKVQSLVTILATDIDDLGARDLLTLFRV